jgi:hypothetical protein
MPTTITSPATTSKNPVHRPLVAFNERREIERVVVRLQDRYPALSSTVIRTAVSVALHAFDGAKVRKFVPLLVERLARERLEHVQEIDRRTSAG